MFQLNFQVCAYNNFVSNMSHNNLMTLFSILLKAKIHLELLAENSNNCIFFSSCDCVLIVIER